MSPINRALIKKFPGASRKALGYYPDMLVYQHDSHQYQTHWQQLSQSPFIYTNGYDMRPAGYLRYAFETVKGWLGLHNHCQENCVQLSLQKFAYYGYLRGFSQDFATNMHNYPLSPTYRNLITQSHSEQISADIQAQLISYYVLHAEQFPTTNHIARISNQSIFGDTFRKLGYSSEIPRLDPQNPSLIRNTIERLEPEINPASYTFLTGTCYAKTVSNHYLAKAKIEKNGRLYNWPLLSDGQIKTQRYLARALVFDPVIHTREKPIYIDYFLEKKNYSNAFSLIKELDDITQAMSCLIKHFSKEQQIQFVEKDSPLGVALAKHYLSQNITIENIRIAAWFNSNLAEQDPVNLFKLLLAEEQHDKAWTLFNEKKASSEFLAADRILLANHYHKLGETHYTAGKKFRDIANWNQAKPEYIKDLNNKKKAYELDATPERQEQIYTCKRLYAQLLLDADIHAHPEKNNCDLKQIIKAIGILKSCTPTKPTEQELHKNTLLACLMRQIDYMTRLISIPRIYDKDYEMQRQHKLAHKEDFEVTLTALKHVTELLQGTKDAEQKLTLGKAYFLLGDINMFFDLPENHQDYFQKAMQAAPSNPFYILRCSEIFKLQTDKLRDKAIRLLKSSGFQTMDYLHWDDERWVIEEERIGTIKGIHYLPEVEEKAWYSFMV